MKGLVFTTFYDFCETAYGEDVLDEVVEAADLPGGGAYTSVGTYPFTEMVSLISALVKISSKPLNVTMEEFGVHCFASWVRYWPDQFTAKTLFDVLADIDSFHEKQVRKLYPDAELPSFRVETRTAEELVLGYHSCKPLADLAVGVIKGAASHLGERVSLRHEPANDDNGDYVRITVRSLA